MEKDQKIRRLKSLENSIENYSDKEYHFDTIVKLLKNEINAEENGSARVIYLSALESIVDYELFKYKLSIKKRPKKGDIQDYLTLTRRFSSIVSREIIHLELQK